MIYYLSLSHFLNRISSSTISLYFINKSMYIYPPNRPFCENCKISLAKSNGKSVHGFKLWHKFCSDCAKAAYNPKFGFLLNKKNYCEECRFEAKDKCQLDLIYIDGNNKNKKQENLKTLCANCNRLHVKFRKKSKKSILDITIDADVKI
jgi:hypothetical protein